MNVGIEDIKKTSIDEYLTIQQAMIKEAKILKSKTNGGSNNNEI